MWRQSVEKKMHETNALRRNDWSNKRTLQPVCRWVEVKTLFRFRQRCSRGRAFKGGRSRNASVCVRCVCSSLTCLAATIPPTAHYVCVIITFISSNIMHTSEATLSQMCQWFFYTFFTPDKYRLQAFDCQRAPPQCFWWVLRVSETPRGSLLITQLRVSCCFRQFVKDTSDHRSALVIQHLPHRCWQLFAIVIRSHLMRDGQRRSADLLPLPPPPRQTEWTSRLTRPEVNVCAFNLERLARTSCFVCKCSRAWETQSKGTGIYVFNENTSAQRKSPVLFTP